MNICPDCEMDLDSLVGECPDCGRIGEKELPDDEVSPVNFDEKERQYEPDFFDEEDSQGC